MYEEWRMREHLIPSNYLDDMMVIYRNIAIHTYSYLLCFNVDWFQPFKHTQYIIESVK